jgi:hypothetical protein
MDSQIRQAFIDFNHFLSGSRAPALIGHSLATVVRQDVRAVADAVARWAYAQHDRDRFASLIAGRNKVFDIFFYRVVRFKLIYDFFPAFEEALVASVPTGDRERLRQLLEQYPWTEIRPINALQHMQEYALERRPEARITPGEFNEDLYRNATHQLLSADKRYTFESEEVGERIGHYQAQIAEVFDDFVSLIKDPKQKREILLANRADRDNVYTNKPRFEIENYVNQLANFAIALLNDAFYEHGIQIFGIIRELAEEHRLDFSQMQRFQEKSTLFNLQKLGEYSNNKTGAILLREVLPLYNCWHPDQLLHLILVEPERRERKFALSLVEAYGREAYQLIVETLESCEERTPWYFVRNLAYLLGRVTTDNLALRARAVTAMAPHLKPTGMRQVNLQVIQALGFIGSEEAVDVLASKLAEFEPNFDRTKDVNEACHKIVSTIIGLDPERGVAAAFEFCSRHNLLVQYRDMFARATLPAALRADVVARVRKEVKKIKRSFSLLGNLEEARALLGAVGRPGFPEVDELLAEIPKTLGANHELAVESSRLRSAGGPPPLLAADRTLHRLLAGRDLPQALCHAYDAGISGRIEAVTREGIDCFVEMQRGQVTVAGVPRYFIEAENAFYWTFLLEGREIATLRFTPTGQSISDETIATPTNKLLRDALFQRGEVQQIVEGVISPDSRFHRRDVHPYYTQFERLDEPAKYEAVWNVLADEVDIATIRNATQLSRHDIYRILFYFLGQNMLVLDGQAAEVEAATVEDGLLTLELYLQRIEARPVHFQAHHAAAEVCAYLEQHVDDAALSSALQALRSYFMDAYNQHRVFVNENFDLCRMVLHLMARYHRGHAEADRQELVDYITFSFAPVSMDVAVVPPPLPEPTGVEAELERIENIDVGNDPYDDIDGLFSDEAVDELFSSFDTMLAPSLADGEEVAPAAAGLTQSEERMLLDLFGNIATAYVKPFKDFVRELDRNRRAGRPTWSDWLDFVAPSIKLLAGASQKMGYDTIHSIVAHLEMMIDYQREQGGDELPAEFCDLILADHQRLADALPGTFALTLSEEELAAKKEGLIVKFILKQLPEVTDRVYNKIIFAGLNSFERFSEIPPEEINHVTGIGRQLAEKIFMKFYQYTDVYYHHDQAEKHAKFVSMFEISLNILKELHAEVERVARAEAEGKPVDEERKQGLIADRQRTLWSLFILLCIKEEHDLIEKLQMSVFEERVRLLDNYYTSLAVVAAFL